jgi:hypothetical protein
MLQGRGQGSSVLWGRDRGWQVVTALTVGGGGTMVSTMTDERARVQGRKIAKCDERECRAKNFRARDLMWDMQLLHASPLSSYWGCAYYMSISHFIAKDDELLIVHLALIRKRDVLHTDAYPFISPHPAWYRSLIPPRFL